MLPENNILIGCAGWNVHREAAAHFGSGGSHLERYSRVFSFCEINSSFYRPHRRSTWERWAAAAPDEFRFSVKAPRAITHELRLRCGVEVLAEFLRQVERLGEKLGPLLFQFPPRFEFDRAVARAFLMMLRCEFRGHVVWEPRHASWFGIEADDLLREFGVGRVAADPACVPAAAGPGGAETLAYFRLHGSPRIYWSGYSGEFLGRLGIQLMELGSRGPVWCVFDNTASGEALRNALTLDAVVQAATEGPSLRSG